MPKSKAASSSHPNPIGKRIRSVRGFTSLNRKAFGKKHQISEATLKSWELAVTTLRQISFERFLNALQKEGVICSKSWLLTGIGTPPYKTGQSSSTQEAQNIQNMEGFLAEASFFLEKNPQSITFQLPDDSMLPFYEAQDYVGGIPVQKGTPLKSSQPYIITFSNGEKNVMLVYDTGGFYSLSKSNPLYRQKQILKRKEALQSLHEIIWYRKYTFCT